MPDSEIDLIDKNGLIQELRSCSPKKEIIILDCRSANDYALSHIKSAANISIPTIMLRRLKENKIDLFSTIKCKDLKSRILGMDIQTLFVLYHNNSPTQSSPDIVQVLSRKLMAEFNDKKIRVVCLAGEYRRPFTSDHLHLFSAVVVVVVIHRFAFRACQHFFSTSFIKVCARREASKVFLFLSHIYRKIYGSITSAYNGSRGKSTAKLTSLLKPAAVCRKMGNKTKATPE